MTGRIILDGQRYPCRAPVLTWEEHGLRFRVGRGARRQTEEIDLFVFHWTGGENPPPVMFRVLEKRKLAVEFAIGAEETTPGFATIWQFCDPCEVDAFHAGKVNRRSAGCEIVNYGFRRFWRRIPKAGRARETYRTRWNGRKVKWARFWPHQIHSAIALAEAIVDSGETEIEFAIPVDPTSLGTPMPVPRTLTDGQLDGFRGFVGHNHVSRRKADPGADLFWALRDNGFDCRPVG